MMVFPNGNVPIVSAGGIGGRIKKRREERNILDKLEKRCVNQRMKVVKPEEKTTLLLDMYHMPFGIATARAAFYHILKNKGVGLDANGFHFNWNNLIDGNISVYSDQPCLRSAHKIWPIPTIFIANHRFFYNKKKKVEKVDKNENGLPPLREVYDFYDGVCCFCYEKIKNIRDASRDHVVPRSKGGGGGFKNIVLMCKSCNSNLGNQYPKKDLFGHEIEPQMKIYASHFMLPKGMDLRPEWRKPLFLE